MNKHLWKIIGCFILATFRLFAQSSPDFIHYTTADGLPSNFEILVMASDPDGFLWVGTNNGLARFDGRRFVPFNELGPSLPLPEKQVRSLFVDSRGLLWVRLGRDGIHCIDLATYKVRFYETKFWEEDFEKITFSIVEDEAANLWFSAPQSICRWERKSGLFSSFPLHHNGKITKMRDLCLGGPGELWVATGEGLFRFDTKTKESEHYGTGNMKIVSRIAKDREGLLWLCTWYNFEQGITVFDTRQRKLLRSYAQQPGNPDMPVNTDAWKIFAAGDTIWFATNSGGVCAFDKKADRFFSYLPVLENPNSLSSAQVHCVYKDHQGNLWVATRDQLSMAPARRKTTHLLTKIKGEPNSLIDRTQFCIEALPDGLMAFGTENGLSLFDPHTERFSNFKLPVYNINNYNNIVISLADADAQSLWVGTWAGLQRVDKRSGHILERYVTAPNSGNNHPANILRTRVSTPYRLHLDGRGTLWILNAYEKLRRLRKGADFEYLDTLVANNDPLDDAVICVEGWGRSGLLFGTRNGLVRLDLDKGRFEALGIRFPGEVGPVAITYMSWSKKGDPEMSGQALVAVANEKIWRIDLHTKEARRIGVSFSTKGDFSIIEDDHGNLWLGMENGLGKISISPTGEVLHSQVYDSRNFLHDNAFFRDGFYYRTAAKDAAGNLYFSGRKGVTVLRPADWEFSDPAPTAKIVSLKINNQHAALDSVIYKTSNLRVDYDESNLTFQFAATDAFMPALTRFSYRLEAGGQWIDLGRQNTVNFSSLAPGSYTFEVRAANSEGVWSDSPARMQVTVSPPWWWTWWAYLLYAVGIGTAVYFIYKSRLRQKTTDLESLRLREMDAFKNRFFTNITHEFRTPLTVIAGMAEEIERQPGTAKELILRNANNLLRLVNQMLDLSKLESGKLDIIWQHGDVVAYLQYLTESFRSYAETKDIQLVFETTSPSLHMDYNPERLQEVVGNLLSNAIKFTPDGGTIIFHVASQEDKALVVKVKDTGIGIATEHLPYIFDRFYQVGNPSTGRQGSVIKKGEGTGIGLALVKELVVLMGGTLTVDSSEGAGAEFTVVLPVYKRSGISPIEAPVIADAGAAGWGLAKEHSPTILEEGDGLPLLLLVEDNADVATYIKSCLDGQFKMLYAENGQLGIDKAIETVPDIIISDVMMPEKDGFELTAFLKNDERTSHIPIILLTAKADVASKIAGLERGADDYLAKPFDKQELRVRLKMLIELRRKLQARYGNWEIGKLEIHASKLDIPEEQPDLEDVFLKKVNAAIEIHFTDAEFDVPDLCRALGMSRAQLYRKIKALTDKSIASYVRIYRLHKGRELLQTSSMTISEIAYQVGFTDPAYFSRTYSEEFGTAPSQVRR